MPDRHGRYRDALASRDFRSLFAAQLTSISGTSIAAVALTVLVYERTNSPLLSSLTFALGFVPHALSALFLSSIVVRWRPRTLVVTCELASAAIAVAMASRELPLAVLFAFIFAHGAVGALASGGRASLVRAAVSERDYVPARSLLRVAAQLAQVGGIAFGGSLLVIMTPRGALLANAASFGCAALIVRLGVTHRPPLGQSLRDGVVRDSLAGVAAIVGRQQLRTLLLLGWLGPMFAVAPQAVGIAYVTDQGDETNVVGWWLAALPLGLILSNVVGVRLMASRRGARLIRPAAAASFVPYLLFVFEPPLAIAIPLLVVAGSCALYLLGIDGEIRAVTPPDLFARTMSLNSAGLMTLQGAGFAIAGATAELTTPGTAIAAAGAAGLATVSLLRLDRGSPHDQASPVVPVRQEPGAPQAE